MSREIKMIWDFKGPNATPTATHHVVHLKEFLEKEKIPYLVCATETVNAMHTMAVVVTNETHVDFIRTHLKPHRGQLYQAKA